MKRGKGDEKIMGPMFPRLHVNDTEKGGPRAPPRNKMALYEQLTIPSQRYNSVVAPPIPNNNSKSVPSTSTSQGTSRERNTFFPLYRSPLAYDANQVLNTEASNSSNQLVSLENNKKPLEEDDFMVPIFSKPGTEMHNERTHNSINGEGHLYLSSNHPGLPPTSVGQETNQSYNDHLSSEQQIKDRDGRTMRVSTFTRNSLDISLDNHGDSLPTADGMFDEDVPDLQRENPCEDTSLRLRLNPQTRGFKDDNAINSRIHQVDNNKYLEKESIDRGDVVSETSMVNSPSEFGISPDDVVDIIGRKQFWKARTAIVNQQRVFAVQVFELHRLLKVQKFIAGSPNFLLQSSGFVGKSSEYVVKTLPRKVMQKDVTHKVIDKVEGTAENAVPKAPAPVPSQQQPMQPVGYSSFSNSTVLTPPGSIDPKMNPLGFHQLSAHQWLVPVMTPTEGLVYKPYPAPGFMGPVCGGRGPGGPTSFASNLMNPPYGTPAPQYQLGMGMPPGIHFGGQGYFPPYGMQMMSSGVSGTTVDHFNPFSGSNPYSQTGQPEAASLNGHGQENMTSSPATRPHASKQGELHGSTASSRGGRPQGIGMVPLSEARGVRSTTEVPVDTPPAETPARVIRAVPHRSTSDSAARLIQSIQQERQLYESS